MADISTPPREPARRPDPPGPGGAEVDERSSPRQRADRDARARAGRPAARLAAALGDGRRAALADVWQALWTSRLAVWAAAVYAVLTVGYQPTGGAPHTSAPFGNLGQLLFGSAERWDGGFYTSIAVHSYHPGPVSAFFPLYPLTIRWVNAIVGSPVISGIAISLVAFAVALYVLHRLVTLELGARHARTAVLVLEFFPTALFFSMVYPESLLLALTIGAVYAARTGHWASAGVLGALASATHNSGVLVAIPIGLLYLYGPRADREPPATGASRRWLPRYLPRLDFLWLLLVPLGLIAFFAYMQLKFGDALRPLHLNDTIWHRHFEFLGGLIRIPGVVWHGLHTIASAPPERLFPKTNGLYRAAVYNVVDAVALVFALTGIVAIARRLPFAYLAYTGVALATLASAPKSVEPLASLPRYILVLFPLQMVLARWLDGRKRPMAWIAFGAVGLGVLSMQFATGRWVA